MTNKDTYFDSPSRSTTEELQRVTNLLEKKRFAVELFYAYPDIVMVLNENRQIVACNQAALVAFDVPEELDIVGKRTGEALKCIHADDMISGCGTSIFCRECGAAKAIKYSNETNSTSEEECRITSELDGKQIAYDLHVLTKPITIPGEKLLLIIITDVSDEKRRNALERIFFHDVLNLASVLKNVSELIKKDPSEAIDMVDLMINGTDQLMNEIQAQKDLRNAESGTLEVQSFYYDVSYSVESVIMIYKRDQVAEGKDIVVEKTHEDLSTSTDQFLLERSLGNLLKNALEATEKGDKVTISFSTNEKNISIHIHNNYVIPENVQNQIFQRSFSTKTEKGRGLGTYSVKLLVESYLGGNASFTSNEAEGTIFTLSIPKKEE